MTIYEFYVNKIKYTDCVDNADISFIPALSRRRMSVCDKVSCDTLNYCYDDDIENIIFSSKTGEKDVLLKMIAQYQKEEGTSPALFSGSVHNFAISSFLRNKKINIPYNALSSGEDSFATGLFTSVISKYENILYVYTDIENNNYASLALNISKKPKRNFEKFTVKLDESNNSIPKIKDFYSFFITKDEKNIKTSAYLIERKDND